jgi:hypothetical protein
VKFTNLVSASFGLHPWKRDLRRLALDIMRDAATSRILNDRRDELPSEEEIRLEKRDVSPYVGN